MTGLFFFYFFRQSPEHIFEVFLEIHQPINNESKTSHEYIDEKLFFSFVAPEILIKYPDTFDDQILKSAPKFAYPYPIPPWV